MTSTANSHADRILNAYPWVREIKGPLEFLADHLGEGTSQNLLPTTDESLFNWMKYAKRTKANKLPITLVVGESRGKHRVDRNQRQHDDGKATAAGTVDALGGVRVLIALLRDAKINLRKVDCRAVVDEWEAPEVTTQSHLVVVGSGEVNLYALFLNGLVEGYWFGNKSDVPDPLTMGDEIHAGGTRFLRGPRGGTIDHVGGIVLLRNPWNPEFRTLWIAGLTGRATLTGCNLIDESWRGDADLCKESIGLVYRTRGVAACYQHLKTGATWVEQPESRVEPNEWQPDPEEPNSSTAQPAKNGHAGFWDRYGTPVIIGVASAVLGGLLLALLL